MNHFSLSSLYLSQSFSTEMQSHSQNLSSLNDVSHDLIAKHHGNDDISDLQDAMGDLNVRWKKLMQRWVWLDMYNN